MNDITSIEGPVENVEGALALLIPMAYGGDRLAECARGIGVVEGDILKVIIPPWLAEKLGITVGSTVVVHNAEGKFNIVPAAQK
jgi:hypothetical protein